MTLFDPCMEFGFFWGTNAIILRAIKEPICDFIQNMSQAPSKRLFKWMKVDKLKHFKK